MLAGQDASAMVNSGECGSTARATSIKPRASSTLKSCLLGGVFRLQDTRMCSERCVCIYVRLVWLLWYEGFAQRGSDKGCQGPGPAVRQRF